MALSEENTNPLVIPYGSKYPLRKYFSTQIAPLVHSKYSKQLLGSIGIVELRGIAGSTNQWISNNHCSDQKRPLLRAGYFLG